VADVESLEAHVQTKFATDCAALRHKGMVKVRFTEIAKYFPFQKGLDFMTN